jgi:hypothetical protein
MILAQQSPDDWKYGVGVFVFLQVGGFCFKWWQDAQNRKRDRQQDNQKFEVEKEKAVYLKELRDMTKENNGKLALVSETTNDHHRELIDNLRTVCKANCANFQPR